MKYRIEKNCTSQREYEVNEKEEVFFDRLYDSLPEGDRLFIHLYRMSNGTLSVYYKTYPIGKIKLQGRVFSMQIFKGTQFREKCRRIIRGFSGTYSRLV